MILRKPYAFFIKYFRVINLIMAVLMCFLVYRSFKIGSFLSDYLTDYSKASTDFNLSNYINIYSFILVLVVIILITSVLSVLFIKKKPKKLYIINLVIYILIMILYGVDYGFMHDVYTKILSVPETRAIRDITFIAMFLQIFALILTLIRATGFDIKQFDFGSDLEQLNIDVKDNEEFEVAVEFDKNKVRRNFRSKIRNLRYVYEEHKFVINLAFIIILIITIFLIFIFRNIYTAHYNENQAFAVSDIGVDVLGSYLTDTDESAKKVTDDILVVVKFDVKKLSSSEKVVINTGLFTLHVQGKSYSQTINYNSDLSDIGVPYTDQRLSTDFESYLLTFEIPKEYKTKKLTLKVNDNLSYISGQIGAKNNYVTLKPKDLLEPSKGTKNNVTEIQSYKGSILGDSNFALNEFSVGNKFKSEYNFCAKNDNCYTSYEYVTPTASGNYAKTLIKMNGEFTPDESMNLDTENLYYFLNSFGTIYYKIGDKWYNHKIDSKLVRPKMKTEQGIYYIEVNKDVEKASNIYFTFTIRNFTYEYVLK